MAAMLFGGVVPGAPAPPPAAAPPPPKPATPRAATPAAAPAPPPAPPAAEIDLLDMAFDVPVSAPATAVDLGPTELLAPTPMDAPPEAPPAPEPAPAPAPAAPEDPFAASGLLDGFSDTPLAKLESSADSKFEYNGQKMAPMPITTAQFGQQWGTLASTSPLSATSSKVASLDQYMSLCESIGAHKVEAITQTSEGICAGIVGGTNVALIHGKVAPGGKVDVTIKSSDANMGGVLAMFMQNTLQ